MELVAAYQERYERILPELTERTRRLVTAADAKLLGHGGISSIHKAAGISRKTLARGIKELNQKPDDFFVSGRSSRDGGGRKAIELTQPGVTEALLALLATKGDPMRAVVWTTESVNSLTEELQKRGFTLSTYTVTSLLREEGYSLKPNKKHIEGTPHEDRDVQVQHINKQCEVFEKAGNPISSIDCKKKEQIGNFKNNGRAWTKKGKAHETNVNVYDFRSLAEGLASPYGIYDVLHTKGVVNVGIDHATAAFAVESIRRWWYEDGKKSYPNATGILITADGGGSNGVKNRLVKRELQAFVNEIGRPIPLCHFPRAMSKWTVIEQQVFSFISINWRAQPLTRLAGILELISHPTTKSGLKVTAMADTTKYPTGIKVSKQEFEGLNIKRDNLHGEWNYTSAPQEM